MDTYNYNYKFVSANKRSEEHTIGICKSTKRWRKNAHLQFRSVSDLSSDLSYIKLQRATRKHL